MKKLLYLLLLIPLLSFSAGDIPIRLLHVKTNPNDMASVKRGAKFFVTHCLSCHTMKYLQYNDIAKQTGITLDKMPLNVKEWFNGIAPPDLTLTAKVHTADWLYTYFHSFYKDPSRPTGWNNLLIHNSSMNNVFAVMQGTQELTKNLPKNEEFAMFGSKKPPYYRVLTLVQRGSLSEQQFNATMTDLVNFLVYASDPEHVEHEHLGFWVLGFLAILFIFAYLLKKAYWKDIHE